MSERGSKKINLSEIFTLNNSIGLRDPAEGPKYFYKTKHFFYSQDKNISSEFSMEECTEILKSCFNKSDESFCKLNPITEEILEIKRNQVENRKLISSECMCDILQIHSKTSANNSIRSEIGKEMQKMKLLPGHHIYYERDQ